MVVSWNSVASSMSFTEGDVSLLVGPMGARRGTVGVQMQSIWDNMEVSLGSIWGHFRVLSCMFEVTYDFITTPQPDSTWFSNIKDYSRTRYRSERSYTAKHQKILLKTIRKFLNKAPKDRGKFEKLKTGKSNPCSRPRKVDSTY